MLVLTTGIGFEPAEISVLMAMLATIGGLFLALILLTMSRNRRARAPVSPLSAWHAGRVTGAALRPVARSSWVPWVSQD